MSLTQFIYLIKRDIQVAYRTRGIMLMIFLMPFFMWAIQIVLPLIRLGVVSAETSQRSLTTTVLNEEINPLDASIDFGLPSMIALILTFLSVIPYISAAIAGEREKKTMESLLSLPISRVIILLSKFVVGTILGTLSLIINLFGFWLYVQITNTIIAPTYNWDSAAFEINLDLNMFIGLALVLFLCTLLNLGIGIALASLAKSAETSRQLFTLILLPVMLFITGILFTGIPEILSTTMNSPLPLLLYLIPWMHALAIFQKVLLPNYFTQSSIYLLPVNNVMVDVIFHLVVILFSLLVVIWSAEKVFEREGLVN
ncbi:MAG: ABC transporter permease subunit [Candidatus Hodarchaeota archaeon]